MARASTLTGSVSPAACSGCGGKIVGRANFCPHCGRALRLGTERRAADAGERKLVSVLFADLCDSLTLIERRDPEEAHSLLEDVVQVMRGEAHRFGGTVTEILGDGIVVLFGAPIALESHADRAACAGLAMVAALRSYTEARGDPGLGLAIRVGIATGEVVLDRRHADTGTSYAATGETPHLASRLQRLARRNGVCVCDQTRRLLTEPLPIESISDARVDGLSRPVTLHHLVGGRTATAPGRIEPAAPGRDLVGRERELGSLRTLLDEARRDGARFVRVTGEAGVGKSRLAGELARGAAADGWTVIETRASALPPGGAWAVLAQAVHDGLRLARDADAPARVAALGAMPASVDDVAALQAVVQIVPTDPSWEQATATERAQRIGRAFAALLAALAAERPVLLTVDDAHLVDEATAAVLSDLPAQLHAPGLAVVATCRPDGRKLTGPPALWRSLRLRPLAQRAARRLLDQILGRSPALEALKQRLIRHTGGRPLFLQEVVRELVDRAVLHPAGDGWTVDRPVETLPLPASIRSTLQSRVDRLAAEDREILRAAAVIGETFEAGLLADVVERPRARLMARLARLATLELVARRGGDPRPLERTRYGFCHSLIREAVYTSILRSRQVELHRRVVAALDADPAVVSGPEGDAILAHHCFAAGLWQRAASSYGEVAERALMRSAPAAAEAACATALEALARVGHGPQADAQRVRLLLLAGDAAFARGDRPSFARQVENAVTLAERSADRLVLVRALMSRSLHAWMEGRLGEAVETAQRGHAAARDAADLDLQIGTAVRLAVMLQARGRYEESIEPFRFAVGAIPAARRGERFGLASIPSISCLGSIGRSLAELGRDDEAEQAVRRAVELAEAQGHAFTLAYVCREAGVARLRNGAPAAALPVLERGLEVAAAAGARVLLAALQSARAYALTTLGQPGRALPLLDEALRAMSASESPVRRSQVLAWRADTLWRLNNWHDALQSGLAALESARRCGEIGHEGWALHALGQLGARIDDGRHALDQALTLARREGLAALERACLKVQERGGAIRERV